MHAPLPTRGVPWPDLEARMLEMARDEVGREGRQGDGKGLY